MRRISLSLLTLLLAVTASTYATPVDDLSSPSPEIRAKAAETIRESHSYIPTPIAPWKKLTDEFKPGDTAQSVYDRIKRTKAACQESLNYLPEPSERVVSIYRLDDNWVLRCAWNESKLVDFRLVDDVREVSVSPPQ